MDDAGDGPTTAKARRARRSDAEEVAEELDAPPGEEQHKEGALAIAESRLAGLRL